MRFPSNRWQALLYEPYVYVCVCRRIERRGLALPYEFMGYRFFMVIKSGRVCIYIRLMQETNEIAIFRSAMSFSRSEANARKRSNDSPMQMNEICNI